MDNYFCLKIQGYQISEMTALIPFLLILGTFARFESVVGLRIPSPRDRDPAEDLNTVFSRRVQDIIQANYNPELANKWYESYAVNFARLLDGKFRLVRKYLQV
jgi:hypothetical protein